MNFPEYKNIDYGQVADEILQFWRENDIFEQSIRIRDGQPSFTFYEGPPSANGTPGIHHVMARTIKDIFCRYQTLKGKQVNRKGGWDTHGLPVELQVEKELGITKDDIGKKISVEEYNKKCRETVMRFTDQWQDVTERMGYWVDMENPYITYENDYIESVWHLLKTLYNKDLLYKGYTIQPYSPAAGTGLSSHELNMPGTYQDVRDTSIVAMFELEDLGRYQRLQQVLALSPIEVVGNEVTEEQDLKLARKVMEKFLFNNYKGKIYTNKNSGISLHVSRRGIEESLAFSPSMPDVVTLVCIPQLLEESIWIESSPSKYDDGVNYHYFLHEIKLGERLYTTKVVVKQIGEVHWLYDIGLSPIKKSQLINVTRIPNPDDINELRLRKDTRLFDLIQISNQDFYEQLSASASEKWGHQAHILAWTTTPWTLPSNSALTIGEKIEYVAVNTYNPYTYDPCTVILAKALLGKYFNEKAKDIALADYKSGDKLIPFEVVASFVGKDLVGLKYKPLIPAVMNDELREKGFRVIAGDFVTTEDGTGVVHTSPTFGADDFRVAQQNGVPAVMITDENGKPAPIVDRKGKFISQVGKYLVKKIAKHGIKTHKHFGKDDFYVKNYLSEDEKQTDYKTTDEILSIMLKLENKAFDVKKYEHTYPHCWRTDKPILYYPLDSWFVKTTAVKDRMIALNNTINWKPESTGTGRFGNWLENLVDWNLSRSRYWGTPLPIWRTEDGTEEICIGSVEELSKEIEKAVKAGVMKGNPLNPTTEGAGFDLHRPYVDNIFLISPSGKTMTRETDLIDVWFDSGAMPFAQWHYPFDTQSLDSVFPADFISEGVDQTRGWFFTLHAISTMVSDSVAFKNVVSTGLVLDKNGNKMSKSKGNAIDPFSTLKQYGADPTRWYMVTNAQPWDNLRFNLEGVTEVRNKFFGTLTNTYNFFALYANLDNYELNEFDRIPYQQLTELDRWILSKLNSLVKDVDAAFADYEPTRAGRAIQDFVCDHLSNWYVRLSRRRFWNNQADLSSAEKTESLSLDKQAAYETLQHCLVAVAQLMSPIAPFYSDWLYRNMTNHIRGKAKAKNTPLRHESVHLSDFQPVIEEWIDSELEASMEMAQRISSLVHSLRKGHKIKVRQPLSKVLIPILNENVKRQIQHVTPLIESEVNVKSVAFLTDDAGILSKKVKPNFKALGPKFGKEMKAVAAGIQAMKAEDVKTLEATNSYLIPETTYNISLEDVEILTEDLPGFLTASENGLTVALDITLTEALRQEGIAREFVNRIQNLRKDTGFDVTDKINITLQNDHPALTEAILAMKDYVCQEVQALSLDVVSSIDNATNIEIEELTLGVSVVKG